ncbi:hypothetical protein FGRMN_2977 [Fusarium graminum]|nr:hypothetical protein FGRMN_2977 [Fusarium graminum]
MEVLEESTKAEFIFLLNGKRIVVSIFERGDDSTDGEEIEYIENRVIDLLETAEDSELENDEDEDKVVFEKAVDEAANPILDVGDVPLSHVAPPLKICTMRFTPINLQEIARATADFDAPLRIAYLQGYVTHTVTGAIIGLLRTCIPPSQNGNTIQSAWPHMPTIPVSMQRRWPRQVTETVNALHSVGRVWGDGKADNICIDPDDNAWLIDLASRFASHWVNKEIAGTKEGDNHGLLKLKAFLGFKCPKLNDEQKKGGLQYNMSSN